MGTVIHVNVAFWIVLGAAALSCFFALTGYSLRAYRRVQWETHQDSPGRWKRSEAVEHLLTPLRLTASFCRGASNLVLLLGLLSWMDAFASGAPAQRVVAAGLLAAAVIAVFGVAIPHAWASYAGDKVLLATLGVLLAVRYALYPVVSIMQAFNLPIRRLCGVREDYNAEADAARQEIMQAATEGHAEGAFDAEKVRMIESVMEFGQTCVREIMTPRTDMFALPADITLQQAAGRLIDAGHTRVPVFEGDVDNIVGVLYAKDLLKYIATDDRPALRSILRKCYFVPETKPLDELLREFKKRKVHLAVVLDEYGGTAGLVTIEDVIEEIFGDISDEYDHATPALMKSLDADSAEVDGRMYVSDLNDAMRLEMPEGADYDTVAGLVFSELGYIPGAGERLETHGARFIVLAADERRITRLRVERLPDARAEED